MQFNLPMAGNYRIGSFNQGGDAVPRSCTCIPDRFQAILQSVFTGQRNVTFTGLPGIMLMNIGKKTNVNSFNSNKSSSLRSWRV